MADNKMDYREMYPNRSRKSRTPDRTSTPKPKTEIDLGLFKHVRKKATQRPLNRDTREYRVKEMLFAEPNLTVEEIMERMGTTSGSAKLSIMLLRDSYLHTVDFLIKQGATGVKGRDRRRGMRR